MPDFRNDLVERARAELTRFGGRHETEPTVHELMMEYWTEGAGRSATAARREIRDRTAWSAAFISFVVKQALRSSGSAASFEFSASHSVYAGAAIRNALAQARKPAFYGVPPVGAGAEKPIVGDIIGSTRSVRIDDYADALDAARQEATYFSHFDIVTAIDGGKLSCIGGNVSQSVSEKTVNLTSDGLLPMRPFKFDSAGQVISGPYICIVKLRT